MRKVILLITLSVFTISCEEGRNKKKELTIEPPSKPEIIVNKIKKEADTSNMIFFNGGTITIGSDKGAPNEGPVFEQKVAPFYLDKNLVSVADFRKFIQATNYKTEADNFGNSGVFIFETGQWTLLNGANWEYPLGRTEPQSIDNHPVTHVSWNDAKAYANWVNKRLPTEFEWEFSAKNGGNSTYPWGESVLLNGAYMANVWQGTSVKENEALDGFLLTSPIGIFGETAAGLTDMAGNVWQWCENSYASYPGNSIIEPSLPNVKSTRGGSFMFDQALEKSFTTTFRSKNSTDTSLFNTGFRCAK